jgi:hypothetical protein
MIGRLLEISPVNVMRWIKSFAQSSEKPSVPAEFEVVLRNERGLLERIFFQEE